MISKAEAQPSPTTQVEASAGGGPLAASGSSGPFSTQPWLGGNRLQMARYAVERVIFKSQGVDVVGNLFLPKGEGRKPAIIVIGPVGFVKEQWRRLGECRGTA